MPLCITYLIFQRFTKLLLTDASAGFFFSEIKLMLAKTAFYNSAEACCFFV